MRGCLSLCTERNDVPMRAAYIVFSIKLICIMHLREQNGKKSMRCFSKTFIILIEERQG